MYIYRFGNWTAAQCDTQDCLEAHTGVDVVVDVAELKALLDDRLPLVYARSPTPNAEIEWPAVVDAD